jgi:hypothetical protein
MHTRRRPLLQVAMTQSSKQRQHPQAGPPVAPSTMQAATITAANVLALDAACAPSVPVPATTAVPCRPLPQPSRPPPPSCASHSRHSPPAPPAVAANYAARLRRSHERQPTNKRTSLLRNRQIRAERGPDPWPEAATTAETDAGDPPVEEQPRLPHYARCWGYRPRRRRPCLPHEPPEAPRAAAHRRWPEERGGVCRYHITLRREWAVQARNQP